MTFINMLQFHLAHLLHAMLSFVLSFFLSPLWNIFNILYFRLLAAAVIQGDLKPVVREECVTLLKGI